MHHGRRIATAVAATALVLSLGAGSVFAGEITGNGKLKEVNGRSECAFSGQEDLQWYADDGGQVRLENPIKGVPAHAQSWGQLPREVRVFLTSIGLNPGIACNPTKAGAHP